MSGGKRTVTRYRPRQNGRHLAEEFGCSLATVMNIVAGRSRTPTDLPRTLFGASVILSANSPQQITLLDAGNILYSDTGGFDVSISNQAAIQMDDSPANPPVAGTVIESLWPRNLFGVRVTRWLAYLRAQTGAVTYMTVSY